MTQITNLKAFKNTTENKIPISFNPNPTLFGISTHLRDNFVWHSISNLFAFVVDTTLVIQDLKSHKQSILRHHQSPIGAICLSEDGSLLASASTAIELSGSVDICIWTTKERQIAAVLSYHHARIQSIAFSFDQTWLVSISCGSPCNVVVWDVLSQTPVAIARTNDPCHELHILKISMEPQFITLSENQLFYWKLQIDGLHQTSFAIEPQHGHAVCGFFDVAGKFFFVTTLGHLLLFEVNAQTLSLTRIIAICPRKETSKASERILQMLQFTQFGFQERLLYLEPRKEIFFSIRFKIQI